MHLLGGVNKTISWVVDESFCCVLCGVGKMLLLSGVDKMLLGGVGKSVVGWCGQTLFSPHHQENIFSTMLCAFFSLWVALLCLER